MMTQHRLARTRRLRSTLLGAAILGALSLAAAGTARADQIYVQQVTLPYKQAVKLSGTVDGTNLGNTYGSGVYAGQFRIKYNTGSTNQSGNSQFLTAWCMDLFHQILPPSSGFTFSEDTLTAGASDNGSPGATLSQDQINNMSLLAYYGDQQIGQASGQTAKNEIAAAIQSAIWEEEYSNLTIKLMSGSNSHFTNSEFTSSDLTTLLNDATNSVGNTPLQSFELAGTTSNNKTIQHLLVVQKSPPSTKVPEPGSLALLGTGLFGLGLIVRRRRRRA